jgi:hypothetical protein
MIIPLTIPPGIVKNGTPYQRRGRWSDGNLVRWYQGSIRAIGGWLRRRTSAGAEIPTLIADPDAEAVRDGFSWRSLNQDQNTVFGSNLKLYHMSQLGDITDITPVGVTTSGKDASLSAGYGENPYGIGAYGVENDLAGQDALPPQRWAFDNFGQLLIAAQRNVGPMYELDPTTLVVSTVTNAPDMVQDLIVTDQRIILTIGANKEPRLVKWSDESDRNTWTAAISNQAGDITLQGSGKLLRVVNVLKQALLVGETDAFTARYIGPPYVYSFDLAAKNCGTICAESVVTTNAFAAWWGNRQFWMFDGAVQELPCDVIEFLNADLNNTQRSKISGFSNQLFSEVWWLYQSNSSVTDEVDSYVMWNYRDNTWWTGRLNRTLGIDIGTLRNPLMVADTGEIYAHEQSGVAVDGVPFIQSAAIDIANGERNYALRYIYPDTEVVGDVSIEVSARAFPSDVEYQYGPYTYTNPTPTRAYGREMKFKFTGLTPNFEIGVMRLEVAPMGGGQR